MSEPSSPSTPDHQQAPLAEQAGHSAEVPSGPQFLPAGNTAPSAPQTPPAGYSAEVPSGPQFLPGDTPGGQPVPQVADAGYPAGAPAAPQPPYAPADPSAYATGDDRANEPVPAPAAPENVGRGILFSLLAIVLGAVLAALIYQMGFIASITSFAMAFAAIWLYAKGAGAPPRAGTWPLIGVIVVGVIISLFSMVGWSLYAELSAEYPSAPTGEIVSYVFELLFNPEVWSLVGTDALIFVAFAALGTFTTLRQLRRSADPQA